MPVERGSGGEKTKKKKKEALKVKLVRVHKSDETSQETPRENEILKYLKNFFKKAIEVRSGFNRSPCDLPI